MQVDTLVFTFLVEGLVCSVVVNLILLWAHVLRRRKVKSAVVGLVESVKGNTKAVAQKAQDFLQAGMYLADDQLEAAVKEITKAERQFYKEFIAMYYRRDPNLVVQLPAAIEALVAPYRQLEPGVPPQATETAEGLEQLQEENKRLMEALKITRGTIDEMLREYSAMYERNNSSTS